MEIHNFRQLKVWKESMLFAKLVYIVCKDFPSDEKYGLTSQIKRSAISIPSNIAEGSGRGSNKDFARFLGIALASAYELETQLVLAHLLEIIEESTLENLITKLHEIQKMIFSFQRKLNEIQSIS